MLRMLGGALKKSCMSPALSAAIPRWFYETQEKPILGDVSDLCRSILRLMCLRKLVLEIWCL